MTPTSSSRPPAATRRRSPRRSRWRRRLAVALAAGLLFAVGVAVGKALSDGPPAPSTGTYVRTIEPLPERPTATR